MRPRAILCLAAASVASVATSVLAEPSALVGTSIDPNTFIVGHPASPRWKAMHANHPHPAVVQAERAGRPPSIDANAFIVQPPASVRWVTAPDADSRTNHAQAR